MLQPATTMRNVITLVLDNPEQAGLIEELAWTIDGVDSVEHQLDGETDFKGLQVIGHGEDLAGKLQVVLSEHGFQDSVSIVARRDIAEEDWAESWKRYWHVSRILPQLLIRPSWESAEPESGDIMLNLDPGSAFGTGAHETTRLMLYLLSQEGAGGLSRSLLDVGTGSGILAIYGAKLGMHPVAGTDNDPNAVLVARENAEQNDVSARIRFTDDSLATFSGRTFDRVVANILAVTLCEMMPELKTILAEDGRLMLSGIMRHQFPQMMVSLEQHGLTLQRVIQQGNWLALVCRHAA